MSDRPSDSIFSKPNEKIEVIIKAISSPRRMRILLLVAENPGVKFEAIQNHIRESPSVVSKDMKMLSDSKLIDIIKSGNNRYAICNLGVMERLQLFFSNLHKEVRDNYVKGFRFNSNTTPKDSSNG